MPFLIYFLIVKDIEIDAEDLEYADKQCVVASINFEMFPMIYTFIGRNCNETHHVICQNVRGMQILIILRCTMYLYLYKKKFKKNLMYNDLKTTHTACILIK